jgi:hypothetical protein
VIAPVCESGYSLRFGLPMATFQRFSATTSQALSEMCSIRACVWLQAFCSHVHARCQLSPVTGVDRLRMGNHWECWRYALGSPQSTWSFAPRESLRSISHSSGQVLSRTGKRRVAAPGLPKSATVPSIKAAVLAQRVHEADHHSRVAVRGRGKR